MSASRPYLAQMAQAWTAFRHYELRSAAEAAGVALSFDGTLTAESILLPVQLPDDASVMKLAARAVLVKSFIDVWATGTTWEEMSAALLAYPRPDAAPYLAEGTTFKVVINKIGRKQTDEERIATIRSLEPLLPWKGKVRMKRADHTFVVIDDDTCDGGPATARFYFGRVVAEGRRDLVGKLDLKKRNYIGTTSLDAELSLLMANLARVRPNDIVYDPFCGTAGTLVAAGAFGARVLGCDLHLPALRGELRTRSGPSKLMQAAKQGIPETFAAYGVPPPIDRIHGDSGAHLSFLRLPAADAEAEGARTNASSMVGTSTAPNVAASLRPALFEAIITDPPYGIREKPAEVADERFTNRELPESVMDSHVPRRALAALEQILSDLFLLSTRSLTMGGRLVFLLPTTTSFTPSMLPPHPGLVLEGASEQLMAARWSRWVVVMRRTAAGEAPDEPPAAVVLYYADGSSAVMAADGRLLALEEEGGAGAAPPAHKERVFERAQIFDRASIRPDGIANLHVRSQDDPTAVLHPRLFGKSAGSRRRIHARIKAAEAGGGPGEEQSKRSAKRRAKNAGRGTYEQQVRDKLGAVQADPGDDLVEAGDNLVDRHRRSHRLLAAAACAAFALGVMVAVRGRSRGSA